MSLNNDMRQNIQSNLDFSSSPTGEAQRAREGRVRIVEDDECARKPSWNRSNDGGDR